MNSVVSNRETLSNDDIAGGQSLYGAPTTPTPTPTPTALHQLPTPSATPTPSRIANISTRLNVGLNSDVLIGGFIVKGSQSKQLILRAIGPSLASYGITGAMADTTLELYDSTGATIATNDNWQTGGQASQITATGLAQVTLWNQRLWPRWRQAGTRRLSAVRTAPPELLWWKDTSWIRRPAGW